ncbi:MAG TPA: hypothetical protein VK840_05760, partial [Candidatus Dormibacteraeota bacterium]|nr:hypothetical protein [Candidatus Dormibacteraeota bacterium]
MAKHLTFFTGRATPKMPLDAIWGVGVYGCVFFVNFAFLAPPHRWWFRPPVQFCSFGYFLSLTAGRQ